MKKLAITVVVALIALGAFAVPQYNELVTLDEAVNQSWSQVENVYQRRADLIPNLVETVRGAADFEQETFEAVAEARSRAGRITFDEAPNAAQLEQFSQAQGELSSALSRLLVTVEQYPELRATEAFRDLQSQLEGTENRISVERRRFTETAQDYNEQRRSFPTVLIAGIMGFDERPYFEATEGAERPPLVDFSDEGSADDRGSDEGSDE